MSVARIGHGVRLQRASDASPAVFSDLGELLEVGGPTLARDAVESTHYQTADRFREFIVGLSDGGEIPFTIALSPNSDVGSDHAKLYADFNNQDVLQYRILFPGGTVAFVVDGFITGLEHALPIDDRMTISGAIKVSGKPALSAVS